MSGHALRMRPMAAAVGLAVALGSACSTTAAPQSGPSAVDPTTPGLSVATPTESIVPSVSSSSAPTESAEPEVASPTPLPPPVFDAEVASAVARHLAEEIGIRAAGTEADAVTREYLERQFRDHGWQVEQIAFDLPQGGSSANVVATWGDRGRDDGPIVVVGAHQDTKPNTVGANDNASGTGVLMSLAGALSAVAADLEVPVMLVALGAEEFQQDTGVHHIGSEHLAQRLAERTVAMLSIDMVGNGPSTRVVRMRDTSDALQQRLLAVAADAGLTDIVPDAGGDISDHGPFASRGVPAAFLWTGPDGRLHTPNDTFEHVSVEDLARAGDLTLAWLLGLTAADREGLQTSVG